MRGSANKATLAQVVKAGPQFRHCMMRTWSHSSCLPSAPAAERQGAQLAAV